MQISRISALKPAVLVLAGALLLAGCGGSQQGGQQAGAAPAAPAVTVVTVKSESVPLVTELPGRTTPYLIAELRPQVTGIVKQRQFAEGSEVKAGQSLYQIDPSTYQATYDSAKASLARAEANLYAARLKAQRYADLVKIEAISKQQNDDAVAALKQAEADVSAARAATDKARIDLEFTRVLSPISGRIGRSAVTPGALVTANQATALATVQQLDPIYVDVTQSSADMLRLKRQVEAGKLQRNGGASVPVRLVMEDGSLYAAEGKLAFSEVSVDEGTGSVTLRAVFPNPKGELLPGMYVRARLVQGVNSDAFLVPHAALSRDPRGNAQVMVVNAEGKVEARPVKAAQSIGDKWVVTDGLAEAERIIVEGLQRARPGAQVQAQEAGAAPAAQGAAPAVAAK
ncbi:MAG: efflux RND transporter periplasmic adaptor subunit [Betaproteobacteria bacterium]|nr:MAG: efflux RND transporter periplasmic adaptor subunit [Betaproteobacteria bacterium]